MQPNSKSRFADCFINREYALMRHAKVTSVSEGSPLVPHSEKVCREVTREFAERLKGMEVVVYHSPLSRAAVTAEVVARELKASGLSVSVTSLDWLKNESRKVSNPRILSVHQPGTFSLFITHLPDIERFLGTRCNPANCTIIAQEFVISGNR